MMKKKTFKKIKTTIPENTFISHIDSLLGPTNNVTLKVTIEDIKIYELDNTLFGLLDMVDISGKVKGLIVGSRNDKDFTALLNDIYISKKCKVKGKFCFLDDATCDVDLPFTLDDNRLFWIQAWQDTDSIQLYGVDINKLYNYNLDKAYDFVEKNTNYLNTISVAEVKSILFSIYKDIIILLKNGLLILNGEKKLDNIKEIVFLSGFSIFAISNDNIIKCVTKNEKSTKFLNANDYKYKKILYTPLIIVALSYDNNIKIYGTITDQVIDANRLINVENIGYVKDNEDIVVLKDGKVYSLFWENDYPDVMPNVQFTGSYNDISIID